MATPRKGETADRILDITERLVQTKGFNGFSYADISTELGLRKASLHHHFPTKAILGKKVIARYRAGFFSALAGIDAAHGDAHTKLQAYAKIYAGVLRKQRMCLCGMLAAEFETLPKAMRDGLVEFFTANETWLAGVLEEGKAEGTLRFAGSPSVLASVLLSSIEGAMMVARPHGGVAKFEAVVSMILADLASPSPP